MMNKEDAEKLIEKRVELVDNILIDGLVTHLIARKVLTKRNAENINVLCGNSKQVEYLLDLLPCRGPDAFNNFCEALKENGQEFIVSNFLKNNKTNLATENSKNEETNIICFRDSDNCYTQIKYNFDSPLKKYHSSPSNVPQAVVEKRHTLRHVISEPASLQSTLACSRKRISGYDNVDNGTPPPTTSEQLYSKKRRVYSQSVVDILNIKPASRTFYFKNVSQAYKMDGIPRGHALLINISSIDGMPPRTGSSVDFHRMSSLLNQLHFDVISYDDEKLTAKNLLIKVREFRDLPSHKKANATVICFFSHGDNGYIFGTDGEKVSLNELFSMFDVDQCPYLNKKPKIFIMQSCRGSKVDLRKVATMELLSNDCSDYQPAQYKEPSMTDALFCYPTQEGYRAWRNQMEGSWFIQALVDVFVKYSFEKDVCAMLNMVNSMVSQRISLTSLGGADGAMQMSEYKSTLRKPYLYFFPGIGCAQS
ncbi:caspase-2-like [Argonauta hians]